jgi:hypothetical protein
VSVRVDLDQNRHSIAGPADVVGDGFGLLMAIQDDREIGAVGTDCRDPFQLRRRDPDAVDHVPHAARGEIFGFAQRGNHGRPRRRGHCDASDVERLRGLEVRAESHAQPGEMRLHPGDVGADLGFVEH